MGLCEGFLIIKGNSNFESPGIRPGHVFPILRWLFPNHATERPRTQGIHSKPPGQAGSMRGHADGAARPLGILPVRTATEPGPGAAWREAGWDCP
jgi:hypothetical protein